MPKIRGGGARGLKKTCVHIDNLIVVSPTWEAHLIVIKIFFQRLIEYGLTVHLNKVVFSEGIVQFLGHIISHGYVKLIAAKFQRIVECDPLKDKKSLDAIPRDGWFL